MDMNEYEWSSVKLVKYLTRAVFQFYISFAVVNLDTINPNAMHAMRLPHHARSAAWQVIDRLWPRNAHSGRIKQQQIGGRALNQAATIGNAKPVGGVAGESPNTFCKRKLASLAYPVG